MDSGTTGQFASIGSERLLHKTNLTERDLAAQVTGETTIYGTTYKTCYFAPGSGESVRTSISTFAIPLDRTRYDTFNPTISLSPGEVERHLNTSVLVKGMAPQLKARYLTLVSGAPLPLHTLIDGLASLTKESVAFDIEQLQVAFGTSCGELERALKEEAQRRYVPSSSADRKGTCSTQGERFRELLGNAGLPKEIKYLGIGLIRPVQVGDQKTGCFHDYTMVLDDTRGEWLLVNSLSPLFDLNIVPREKLQEAGQA